MDEKKYFTVEEAESLIPKLKPLIAELRRLKQEIEKIQKSKELLANSIQITSTEGFNFYMSKEVSLNKEFHRLNYEFFKNLEEVNNIGCILKDLDLGLVDFYFKFESRDVLLCWQYGEEKVGFWHELGDGFAGRRRIIDINELIKDNN